MRRVLRLLPAVFALFVSAMLPLEAPPPSVEAPRPKLPGLESVLVFFAPPAEGASILAAPWPAIEKIPGVVWVGAGPRPTATGFERDGVGVLRGLGAVEMTARGARDQVSEIDVLVTSPFTPDKGAADKGHAPQDPGFAAAIAVERLTGAVPTCPSAYRATLPGHQPVYLQLRQAAVGVLYAFRRDPPVCS